ncbi:MAG: hypothetical protein M1837_005478 [Sclerophora amabilis]|nr:MAG: hypothetical protein M1837_005478 [Sclerophora amabilis]
MSSRKKQPSTTAQTPARNARPSTTVLPTYQPLLHPLTPVSARSLESLQQAHSLNKLRFHISTANNTVTNMAGEVNDRLFRKQDLLRRRRARRAREVVLSQDDNVDDDADDADDFGGMRETVEKMTEEMEDRTRRLIDTEAKVEGLQDVLKEVKNNVDRDLVNTLGTQQGLRSQQASQGRRRQRRRQGNLGDSEEEEEEDEDDESDGDPESGNNRRENAENVGPFRRLQTELQDRTDKYDRQSMRNKYSTHNSYVGFKRIVHDAQNPGDDGPPVPHADTWFPSTNTSSQHRNPSSTDPASTHRSQPHRGGAGSQTIPDPSARSPSADSSDDDIAIAREKTSLRCPLTFLPFKDPVTSTKCPHSFERAAILDMIANSPIRDRGRAGGRGAGAGIGEKAVNCPVCAEKILTVADLVPDPLLMRKVRRLQRLEEEGAEEEEEDGGERAQDSGRRGAAHSAATTAAGRSLKKEAGDAGGKGTGSQSRRNHGGEEHGNSQDEDRNGFANLNEDDDEDEDDDDDDGDGDGDSDDEDEIAV